GESARFAAIERDRVKVRIAGLLAQKEDLTIVLHPAQRILSALSAADPGVVMDSGQHARLAGLRIEREYPAILVIPRTPGDHSLRAVLAPYGHAELNVAILGRVGLLLTVIDPFHVAGLRVEDGKPAGSLVVADIRAAGNVLGIPGVADVVGNDRALARSRG